MQKVFNADILMENPDNFVRAEHITNIVNERGASVQAGNVLREWISAYRFAIGLDKFDEHFLL